MDKLKPGDRVEVLGEQTAGQQGTVSRIEDGFVMVTLDERSQVLGAVTLIAFNGAEVEITSVFQAHKLRRVVTPSA